MSAPATTAAETRTSIGWPWAIGRCANEGCETAITAGVFCEPCDWALFPPTKPSPPLGLTRIEVPL